MRYHFSGIAGVGMNPLAQLMRARGHAVQGSDRSFDQGKNLDVAGRLTELGIVVKPQDGSAVSPNLDRFVYSTAVEAETQEVRAARSYGIERVPRHFGKVLQPRNWPLRPWRTTIGAPHT